MQVLVIGATGMLGRPVVRRLVADGFEVRAMVREPGRARRLLPPACRLVAGDVEDDASLAAAAEGAEAVYVSLAAPRSPRRRDVERAATPRVVEAARRGGAARLLKISFMGVPAAADLWWQVRHKDESEQAVRESGLAWTIFQPTWFAESLGEFAIGRRLLLPRLPDDPVWWIAADDYARQVSAALRSPASRGRSWIVQGPQGLSFGDAARRYAAASEPRRRVTAVPMALLRALALASADARYLRDLLAVTFATNTTFQAAATWEALGAPTLTVEHAARENVSR